MLQPTVIAIDFDDVIFDFNGPFIAWHNLTYGTSVGYEDITDFDLTKIFNTDLETMIQRFYIFHTQHWQNMPLMPGALQALTFLKTTRSLHSVTARCESLQSITKQLLDHHAPNIFVDLHLTNGPSSKHHDRQRSKVTVCREIGAIAMIDDNPKQVDEFAASEITLLVPDRPWNQNALPNGVIRCGSWRKPGTCWEAAMDWIDSHV